MVGRVGVVVGWGCSAVYLYGTRAGRGKFFHFGQAGGALFL